MGARERSPALELAKEIAAAKLRDLEAARAALRERHRAAAELAVGGPDTPPASADTRLERTDE